jgi:two-component system chemotaxis sensor kinase CheA
VDSCIKKGLIDASEALLLDDSEKVNLIFKSGSSTSTRKITDISGRGIGMNAVITKINTLGGKITVNTEPGKGTSFMILIPDNKQCSG